MLRGLATTPTVLREINVDLNRRRERKAIVLEPKLPIALVRKVDQYFTGRNAEPRERASSLARW